MEADIAPPQPDSEPLEIDIRPLQADIDRCKLTSA
jgi:hypothetical protein